MIEIQTKWFVLLCVKQTIIFMNYLTEVMHSPSQPTLSEVLGELLPTYDLKLYKELGQRAMMNNTKPSAIVWFTRGLALAREQNNEEQIQLFKEMILRNIDVA